MTLTITGTRTSCTHPYNGLEPIELRLSGALPNHYYELSHPTNIAPGNLEPAREVTAWVVTDGNGTVNFTFNGNPSADYVKRATDNQWLLPAGTYELKARQFEDVNWTSAASCPFNITGTAQASVTAMNKARKKK